MNPLYTISRTWLSSDWQQMDLPSGVGVMAGMECMEGSATYLTYDGWGGGVWFQVSVADQNSEGERDATPPVHSSFPHHCWPLRSLPPSPSAHTRAHPPTCTGMPNSHTRSVLSSLLDTKRRLPSMKVTVLTGPRW